MATLYTQEQVEDALVRAQVALYIISQKIQDEYLFMYNFRYATYKALQYDIYILFRLLSGEKQFVTFSPVTSLWEVVYYELVARMIKLTKSVDNAGVFGGSLNINYQSTVNVVITSSTQQYNFDIPSFFPDFKIFTYDGTNNIQTIAFTPKGVVLAYLNTRFLNPNADYSYVDNMIILEPSMLRVGVEYSLNLVYLK